MELSPGEALVAKWMYQPGCAHHRNTRGSGKLGGMSNWFSGYRNKRFGELLPKQHVYHPLVQVGKQVRQVWRSDTFNDAANVALRQGRVPQTNGTLPRHAERLCRNGGELVGIRLLSYIGADWNLKPRTALSGLY
jgi:hypothetical protein